jgi:hypothetical protein
MSKVAVFTSATYTYLSRARTLAQTLKKFHPDWHLTLMLPDEPPSGVDIDWSREQFDSVLRLEDLRIDRLPGWLFKHDVVELCTAVKGFALRTLQERGFDKVIYIDPDIAVFSPLDSLTSLLEENSILLTPHVTVHETEWQAIADNERAALKYGVYNLGFVAVRTDGVGREFANWWSERLTHFCRDDVPAGLFTDQRWCDLVPGLFDRVHVIRNPGYNVASWNLSKRRVTINKNGEITVNGEPLRFFHFTKVDHVGEVMLRRYAGQHLDVLELMHWYLSRLRKNAVEGVPPRWWRYATFDDGAPIERSARRRYAESAELQARFPNPFSVQGEHYRDWLARQPSA